jgi:hypothetical protein
VREPSSKADELDRWLVVLADRRRLLDDRALTPVHCDGSREGAVTGSTHKYHDLIKIIISKIT